MAFTMVAWTESVDTAGVLTNIKAVPDQHITTEDYDVLVPGFAPNLACVHAEGVNMLEAQISSPTLRKGLLYDIAPVHAAGISNSDIYPHNRFMSPIPLTPGEGLRALVAESAVGAVQQTVFAWLMSELEEAPAGDIITVKTTATTTLSPYAWSLVKMSFTQQLEAGQYAVVGLRPESAGCLAARLVMPGSEYRPGVLGSRDPSTYGKDPFRYGAVGLFGTFEHTFPPQVEFFSFSADTAETVYFDLIKL